MALNKLKSFRWINGTSATDYVSLNKDEFDALIELVKRGGITKDIQGYIHPINSITSYQQYLLQLNCPNLVLVDPIVESVDYNVTLDSVEMYEGTRNKINIYLIDLAALDIRIISHTIVRDNAITDEQIRNRISIDSQNGYIVVDSARENSTWTDNVRIEILPKYEDWESELYTPKVLNVLVKANKVTGAQIQTPEVVKPGSFFYPKVVLMPADNSKQLSNDPTKGIYLVPFGENFQMTIVNNTITAYAPNNEGTYQLGCRVYAFGLDRLLSDPSDNIQVLNPYIQFIVTTDGTFNDISTANPKITLQKVDSQDEPIGEPIVLTGTVSGSSLVYTYGGGNVAGDGSEIYKVTFDAAPEGYKNIQQITITPNQVITEIAVQYVVKRPGIYVIYSDGYVETAQDVIDRNYSRISKTPVGVLFEADVNGDSVSFIVPNVENALKEKINDGKGWIFLDNSEEIQGCTKISNEILAASDFNGDENRDAILAHYANHEDYNSDKFLTRIWYETTITISGIVLRGHPCTLGEKILIYDNSTIIKNIFVNYFGWNNTWNFDKVSRTSTLHSKDKCWAYRYNSSSSGFVDIDRSGSGIFGGADNSVCCMTYKK